MLLSEDTVRAYVAEELPAAKAWAQRRGRQLSFDEEALSLTLPLYGPRASDNGDPEAYCLRGTFDDYRAVPPTWWFIHPDSEADIGPAAYPASPSPHPRGSGLFLASGPTGAVICAHFNRLAYAEEQGPHGDWGATTNWLNTPPSNYTRAETIGDMLARISLEVDESQGRMAPLP
ncbi:MAG TPA: hypothetical protein VK501_17055 [Baekduia sp.]|uniref:hypothetical protein n=1 Tax=Baekduia sp. TaxID=2600305 RepID=UPI002C46A6A0|nr:hypothetical protein [Baekduia sp.]HMJ35621.1 hypothetical protein [Baekduia sp.]